MQRVFYLMQKEFRQLFRNHFMLRLILFAPLLQLIVLGHALNTDLKNVDLGVLDLDNSRPSRELISSFYSSDLFRPIKDEVTPENIETLLSHGDADMVLWIPRNYARDVSEGKAVTLGLYVDGTNSSLGGLASGYAGAILREKNLELMRDRLDANPMLRQKVFEVTPRVRFLFNPELVARDYMVPGVIVLIITIISGMLTGMAVVREKEIGTLEQLMVTPITPLELIAGKTIPFVLISFFDITLATAVAIFYFKLPFAGSFLLLAGAAMLYLVVMLGIGLFASTVSQTQQQAMFTVWFFMVFGIITSGFFYPLENMPQWVQAMTVINPLRYILVVVRGVFLKDVQPSDIANDLIALAILGVVVFGAAVLRFQKRVK